MSCPSFLTRYVVRALLASLFWVVSPSAQFSWYTRPAINESTLGINIELRVCQKCAFSIISKFLKHGQCSNASSHPRIRFQIHIESHHSPELAPAVQLRIGKSHSTPHIVDRTCEIRTFGVRREGEATLTCKHPLFVMLIVPYVNNRSQQVLARTTTCVECLSVESAKCFDARRFHLDQSSTCLDLAARACLVDY